jgi:hypothetical protein
MIRQVLFYEFVSPRRKIVFERPAVIIYTLCDRKLLDFLCVQLVGVYLEEQSWGIFIGLFDAPIEGISFLIESMNGPEDIDRVGL